MSLISRIKWLFKKPKYYSFENFNIDNYEISFQYLSDEILMDISKLLRKKFNPNNLEVILIEFKEIIAKEIKDSKNYRKKNNCIINYFIHEDFFKKNNLIFLSQCISDMDKEIGEVISNIVSFEEKECSLIMHSYV